MALGRFTAKRSNHDGLGLGVGWSSLTVLWGLVAVYAPSALH
jgi:hypothetical protein